MCLILIAYRSHPDFPLVVAANRDEFHVRPTAAAEEWDGIVAGRDLQSGGTWLGVTRSGRFAAVTNYREERLRREDDRSRGLLVTEFLRGDDTPEDYLGELAAHGDRYGGFGLFVSDSRSLGYFSNRGDGPRILSPGFYGLSNHLLDSEWPKVERGKAAMRDLMAREKDSKRISELLLQVLADRDQGANREHAILVVDPVHGTRSSTVVIFTAAGDLHFTERSFSPAGEPVATRTFELNRVAVSSRA